MPIEQITADTEVEQFTANPEAETQGREAFSVGASLKDNPYAVGAHPWSRRAWVDGWCAARKVAS